MKSILALCIACSIPALAHASPGELVASASASRPRRSKPGPEYLIHLTDIAGLYVRQEKWEQALPLLEEAYRRQPDNVAALEDLTSACLQSPPCAPRRIALLEEALAKVPDPTRWLDDLVDELTRLGKRPAAVRRLSTFVTRHPEDDVARTLLMETALEDGQRQLAVAQAQILSSRSPNDFGRRRLLVELLREAGQYAAYRRELASLTREFPKRPGTMLLQAELLLELGQVRMAADELARLEDLHTATGEDLQRLEELKNDIRQTRRDEYTDFRSSVRWAESTDDLQKD